MRSTWRWSLRGLMLFVLPVACASGWLVSLRSAYHAENEAAKALFSEYQAFLQAAPAWGSHGSYVDIPFPDGSQLQQGRLHVPVHTVRFNGVHLDDRAWELLSKLEGLQSLVLWECTIDATGPSFSRLPNVTKVAMHHTPLPADPKRELWTGLTLQQLELNDVGDHPLAGYNPAQPQRQLQALVLTRGQLDSTELAAIWQMHQLKRLEMNFVEVDPTEMAGLRELARVESLTLRGIHLPPESLPNTADNFSLRELALLQSPIDDEDIATIVRTGGLLTTLRFDRTQITDQGVRRLLDLMDLRSLAFYSDELTQKSVDTLKMMYWLNWSEVTIQSPPIQNELDELQSKRPGRR
ncbi:hypothetical protein [Bremerella cremea]|uniref:hypothetical protein n=1 Tax=Bremerella cremea TaxID=1031537 RepID=UPI0031EF7275